MRSPTSQTAPRLAVFLVFLMVVSVLPISQATQGRAGPDVTPTTAVVTYSSSTDHTNHAALSSQNPSSIGMNRPADLWIIDGMLGLSQQIEVTVENVGDSVASSFDVDIEILHDEYNDFVLHSHRGTISSLGAGSSSTLSTTWVPDYSGNHTIRITTLLTNDANQANDVGTRSLTIGNMYDQAETTGSWSLGPNWYLSDEASLSGTNSFHVGGSTSSSNYGNNWDTSLVSATIDTSDAHSSPTRGIGLGFFYTGSSWSGNPPADSGDGMDIDVWDGSSWVRITPATISAEVDTDFSPTTGGGSNWLISVNTVGNAVVPYWGLPASAMNSQFKFRINFHSNAVGTNIGHWVEDIVMFYDQKARAEEFSIAASTGTSGHAQAGEWAETTVSISNSGNLSDSVALSVSNLPADWNYRFQHMTGSQIHEGVRIDLGKGESRTVKLLVQPAAGSSLGSTNVNVHAHSLESTVVATSTASFIVDPGYQPSWVEQDPGFPCAPGNACDFEITLQNDGDGQDTFSLSTNPVLSQNGWTFGLKWDQSTMVTIAKGATETITITANLPQDALPGMRANTAFTATSQADPNKVATMRANVTASMVSNAAVGVDPADIPADGWWIDPGESITVPFTIWNNATQQDSFVFDYDSTGVFGWTLEMLSSDTVIIGPGSTARVLMTFTAPDSAQANDPGPIVTPHIISSESSMSGDEDVFSGIRVRQLHDLTLTMNTPAIDVIPGQVNEIPFEIENLGNGAENVLFDLDAAPGWTWWVEVNSANLSGPLSLSTTYDGNSMALGKLWIDIPGSEDANQEYQLTFTVMPMDGLDSSPEDATISWQYRTQMTAIPELTDFENSEVSLWLGQSETWTISLQNSGNTYDSSMRVRISSDKNLPGMVVQAVTSRGTGQLNGWIDVPMGPGGDEEIMIFFETIASNFPFGESILLTVEVEGGRVTNQDSLQTITTQLRVNVDQKRSVDATWNLDSDMVYAPGEMNLFSINVTTDSTMPITVNLSSSVPDSVFIDCRPRAQDGAVVLFMPASSPAPAQTYTIDCDISLEADELERTVNFVLTDDQGDIVWISGPTHLKTKQVTDEGNFAGFGDVTIVFGSIIGGIAFIAFFIYMTMLIVRRRRQLDDFEEEGEDDEITPYGAQVEQVVQQPVTTVAAVAAVQPSAPAGPMPGAPGPMPGAPGPMPASAPVAAPVVESTPEPSPADFTDEQLRASGWNDTQIQELRGVVVTPTAVALDSLGPAIVESETSPALPVFHCIVTGNELTANDAWWQCPSCGGFAIATAIEQYTNCPSCNAAR